MVLSLASHTLQSQEKEGLVTSRTQSCTRSRILEQPITFEILKCAVLPVATRRVMRRRFYYVTENERAAPKRKMVPCLWPRCRKEPDDVDRVITEDASSYGLDDERKKHFGASM